MKDDLRKRLATEVREKVPDAAGTYAFFDAGGRLLYVGKSVSLRRRMAGYFGRNPLRADPHLGKLVSGIRAFAWWQTSTELLALLLENAMIKEHLPPMNTRQREFEENRYLELTGDDFPACVVVEHEGDFGPREVFGPLRDRYFAATLQDVLHETLGVRTCCEPEPVRRCVDYDIGMCSGPCRGAVDAVDYSDRVLKARNFLRGDVGTVVRRLEAAMDRAASGHRYEEAARLRDAARTCERFGLHQRFATDFAESELAFRCAKDGTRYRFQKGALAEPQEVVVACGIGGTLSRGGAGTPDPEDTGRRAAENLHRPPTDDRRFLSDRSRIVCSWMHREKSGASVRVDDIEAARS